MFRYVVSNLGPQTSQVEQDKLVAALGKVKGIKDAALNLTRHEITLGIAGPKPWLSLLQEALAGTGFTLGNRMQAAPHVPVGTPAPAGLLACFQCQSTLAAMLLESSPWLHLSTGLAR